MLTRRFLPFTAALLSTLLSLVSACDGDNNDDNAGDETGNSSDSNSSDSNSSDSNSSDGNSSDSGSEVCDDACLNLEACGIPLDECLGFCTADACGTCLANSDSCGQDCANACAGGGDGDGDPTGDGDGDPTGDGDGDPSGDGDGDVPAKECVINDDCGLSFECVSCHLNDAEGWCEQSSSCNFDADCGFGGKCGYNVESSDWRCLPADYCV